MQRWSGVTTLVSGAVGSPGGNHQGGHRGGRIQNGDLLDGETMYLDGVLVDHSLGTPICKRRGEDHIGNYPSLMVLLLVGN